MTSSDVEIPRSAYNVAFPLAVVGGYVDAVGFLTLAGLFVAHMSGNTVRLGVLASSSATATGASPHGGVWASYLAGGVLGAFVAFHWDLWSLTLPLAVLVVLIVVDLARRA